MEQNASQIHEAERVIRYSLRSKDLPVLSIRIHLKRTSTGLLDVVGCGLNVLMPQQTFYESFVMGGLIHLPRKEASELMWGVVEIQLVASLDVAESGTDIVL